MKVFDFAIKMELDGKQFYEKLARETDQPGLRTIFTALASDEQKHRDIFAALKEKTPVNDMQDSRALEQARNIFAGLLAQRTEVPVEGDLEGYSYAMKLETDSFRLYEGAAAEEPDQGLKELLLRIAAEEQKHFTILRNIYDFINAPNQYLAWREFSNIDEFHQFGRDND